VERHYRLYYATQAGHVYGHSANGQLLFDVNVGAPVDSYPALSDDQLIVGARNGTLTSISC
jgi:PQQ-like domain